jgi:ABC-2 type transport system ATP-binding protein
MDTVIEIDRLHKRYGEHVAVHDVSLTVARGEVLGILGPNGAGKTTTVECLAGLRIPDGGSVRVLGLDPAADPEAVRRRVGVQLQVATLPDRMRVAEAMGVFAAAYDRDAAAAGLLEHWGLASKRRSAFGNLSGGERQRLCIALALLGDPEVVVLDELTTGLDPAARRETWALVRRLQAEGRTVVLVSHAMDEVEALCDRAVVIVGGRVAADGTPAELTGTHASLEAAYLSLAGSTLEV